MYKVPIICPQYFLFSFRIYLMRYYAIFNNSCDTYQSYKNLTNSEAFFITKLLTRSSRSVKEKHCPLRSSIFNFYGEFTESEQDVKNHIFYTRCPENISTNFQGWLVISKHFLFSRCVHKWAVANVWKEIKSIFVHLDPTEYCGTCFYMWKNSYLRDIRCYEHVFHELHIRDNQMENNPENWDLEYTPARPRDLLIQSVGGEIAGPDMWKSPIMLKLLISILMLQVTS